MNAPAGLNSPLPGPALGILGGGQLGRMMILAGRELGLRLHVFDPDPNCCAGAVADILYPYAYDDHDALKRFADGLDWVTLEFENVPAMAASTLARKLPVRPNTRALEICQHRVLEKTFLRERGIACAPFAIVHDKTGLRSAAQSLGLPAVLKQAESGYDGKGQCKLESEDDFDDAEVLFGGGSCVLEKWIPFRRELSILCARRPSGETQVFPLVENIHRNHILHATIAPADVPESLVRKAEVMARAIAEALDYVGLLAVEFFEDADGEILVNEMAPRPHNSGHYSIDACAHSQFELHCRAVCAWPLVAPTQRAPAVMVNLLGDLWPSPTEPPDFAPLLSQPGCHLHLYDKGEPRAGRKMGHFTVVDPDPRKARERAREIFRALGGEPAF
ncbi:MAG: 5-(carboxyamino)imidazole ribonucleotide synthase [Opitutales bacterium]